MGIVRMAYWPSPLVTVRKTAPVPVLVARTLAPGITPPAGSRITPPMLPLVFCAYAANDKAYSARTGTLRSIMKRSQVEPGVNYIRRGGEPENATLAWGVFVRKWRSDGQTRPHSGSWAGAPSGRNAR